VPPEAFAGPSSATELRLDFAGQQAAHSPPNSRQGPATLSSWSTFTRYARLFLVSSLRLSHDV